MFSSHFSPSLDDMPDYTVTYFRRGKPSSVVTLKWTVYQNAVAWCWQFPGQRCKENLWRKNVRK